MINKFSSDLPQNHLLSPFKNVKFHRYEGYKKFFSIKPAEEKLNMVQKIIKQCKGEEEKKKIEIKRKKIISMPHQNFLSFQMKMEANKSIQKSARKLQDIQTDQNKLKQSFSSTLIENSRIKSLTQISELKRQHESKDKMEKSIKRKIDLTLKRENPEYNSFRSSRIREKSLF